MSGVQNDVLRLTNVFHMNVEAYAKDNKRYIINQGGTSCFHKGQLVMTSNGNVPISDIKVGDLVLSYSESRNENVMSLVTDVMRFTNTKKTLKVTLTNGEQIIATEDHKFYYGGGWHSLKYIVSLWRQGDVRSRGAVDDVCVARCISPCDIVSVDSVDEEFVYDITVKDSHCFYLACGGGYLVHNSSKTFSTLQLLVRIAMVKKKQIDIVGLTVPHLKAGVLNDIPHVMAGFGLVFDDMYNSSDKVLKFPSGGVINFIAIDKVGKAHGGRRDILYINEANHLSYPISEQLMIRTRETVFIDYNPTSAFWVHNKLMKEQPENCKLIKSTYRDNQFLEQHIIDTIESKRGDGKNNFWRVYGLGELGISEGLVFDNFKVEEFDKEQFDKYRHGVDWGFSADPFVYVRSAIHNNKLYICDEVYQRKLMNKDAAELVKPLAKGQAVICDSAEPKSVSEFRMLGINAHSAKKGQGSIESGIKFLQALDGIVIHPDCTNAYNEFMNYQWKVDKNGENTASPIDDFNHLIDALRYSVEEDQRYNSTKLIGLRPF